MTGEYRLGHDHSSDIQSQRSKDRPFLLLPHDVIDRPRGHAMIRGTIVRRDLDAAFGQRRPNGTGSARPGHPDGAMMEVHL
jgi:hypothetical protein